MRVRARVSLEEAPPLARVAKLSEGRVHRMALPRLRRLLHPHQVAAAKARGGQRGDHETVWPVDELAVEPGGTHLVRVRVRVRLRLRLGVRIRAGVSVRTRVRGSPAARTG